MYGIPAPRTVDQVDDELAQTTRAYEQALSVWAANTAELARIRIDQLLDERLTIMGGRDARTT